FNMLSIEDLIADEDMVIAISHAGYAKRLPLPTYRAQRPRGPGQAGEVARGADAAERVDTAASGAVLVGVAAPGHRLCLQVHEVPAASGPARGRPLVNLLSLGPDERVAAIVPVREFDPALNLMFATRRGTVKKTSLAAYRHVRVTGVNAINIEEGDE